MTLIKTIKHSFDINYINEQIIKGKYIDSVILDYIIMNYNVSFDSLNIENKIITIENKYHLIFYVKSEKHNFTITITMNDDNILINSFDIEKFNQKINGLDIDQDDLPPLYNQINQRNPYDLDNLVGVLIIILTLI